jgi:hypothetical protein
MAGASVQFERKGMGLEKFLFVDDFDEPNHRTVFVGLIPPGLSSVKSLLEAIEAALLFPGYFGRNWNAVYDCLRDFEWISQRTVALVHCELPHLPEEELRTYLAVLRDASEDWQADEAHELYIVLPRVAKDGVFRLVSGG